MGLYPEEQSGAKTSTRKAPPDLLARSGLPVPEFRGPSESDVSLFNADFRRLVARISKLIARIAPTAQGESIDESTTILAAHAPQHEHGGSDEIDVTGLAGVLAQAQIPQSHDIESSFHYAVGLVAGEVMRASGPATFSFAPIQDADLPASIARDTEVATAVEESVIFGMALGGEW